MTVLVTGAGGQVGSELVRRAARHGIAVAGRDREQLDITRAEDIRRQISGDRWTAVINAAAYTAVDRAESDADAAFAVNRDGPAHLARACAGAGIPLIHLSTDYVFDGTKPLPYTEDDPVRPLGVYGKSKAAGEQEVRRLAGRHIILRTAWVYAARGRNFVTTMLRLGQERAELSVVDDQFGCPTAAGDIAEALLAMIPQLADRQFTGWGTYHYCGSGRTSWYEFAAAIFAEASRYTPSRVTVRPIPASDYPTPARRPANSVLDSARIGRVFGIPSRDWRVALPEVIESIYKQ